MWAAMNKSTVQAQAGFVKTFIQNTKFVRILGWIVVLWVALRRSVFEVQGQFLLTWAVKRLSLLNRNVTLVLTDCRVISFMIWNPRNTQLTGFQASKYLTASGLGPTNEERCQLAHDNPEDPWEGNLWSAGSVDAASGAPPCWALGQQTGPRWVWTTKWQPSNKHRFDCLCLWTVLYITQDTSKAWEPEH